MKKFTSLLTVAMVLVMAFSAVSVNALSYVEPFSTGDADLSYKVTVRDATLIQKHVAKLEKFSKGQLHIADADNDGSVTVRDATVVQKYVAKIIDYFEEPKYYNDYMFAHSFNASIDSGLATPDEQVTFIAEGSSFNTGDITYEFFVNGELVQAESTADEFTCAFKSAGTYSISVNMYDVFGNTKSYSTDYVVAESRSEDEIYVKAFYRSKNLSDFYYYNSVFTASAGGSSGEYEYCFTLNGKVIKDFSTDNINDELQNFEYNKVDIPVGENTFGVIVKDVATGETATAELVVNVNLII